MTSRIRVLLTGGSGFIGSHLAEALLDRNREVVMLDKVGRLRDPPPALAKHKHAENLRIVQADVTDLNNVLNATKGITTIYHLAALASHRLSVEDPRPYIMDNVAATTNILEAARLYDPKPRVVFASSASVYGKQQPPLREDMELQPDGPYGLSKYFGERLCRMYSELYGVPVVILRYFNVIGERARSNIVIAIFAERITQHLPPVVNGLRDDATGEFTPASRDFNYVKDIARGTILAGEVDEAVNHTMNLGSGRATSVLDLAELMLKALDAPKDLKPIFENLSPHESLTNFADARNAEKILRWKSTTSLEEIVDTYCRWYTSDRPAA